MVATVEQEESHTPHRLECSWAPSFHILHISPSELLLGVGDDSQIWVGQVSHILDRSEQRDQMGGGQGSVHTYNKRGS